MWGKSQKGEYMEQQVPAILVISHGFFCRELVNSVKMVFGDVTRLERTRKLMRNS